jgi:hypothetical protein
MVVVVKPVEDAERLAVLADLVDRAFSTFNSSVG